ncbi:hypothetical protein [Caulobacter henricii]|uniref:Uncharacterized protein n=1 Tax=Caulobacter henricii TaxID=69395 RepID=A0A0N7JH69_9CAUL|nr:hypothetical protein [Caulobacter henricii]ALL12562.1 hypothetical protein AQ619_03865 [Caulobacter henricii]
MARTKQSPEFDIVVEGEPYVWRLHRQPGWSSDSAVRHGVAIAARHKEAQREVVMEFPAGPEPRYGAPLLKPAHIATALVAKAIASAIAAGWDPHSRGKTITIVVDSTGG